jgi:isocitrate lyase
MSQYSDDIQAAAGLIASQGSAWDAIEPESVARMKAQNRFQTGLDIARYTAKVMREDMARYDADSSQYTQSLGCWHGFIGQQKMISIKKHFGTTNRRYLYLSGWMVAALRSKFGPLPDQSMHEKTTVPELIEELYTFLRQADARELGGLFRELDKVRKEGNSVKERDIKNQIENFQTHVVPIIARVPVPCRLRTRYRMRNSVVIRTARSRFHMRTFWRKFAHSATHFLNSVSTMASSSRAPTRSARD